MIPEDLFRRLHPPDGDGWFYLRFCETVEQRAERDKLRRDARWRLRDLVQIPATAAALALILGAVVSVSSCKTNNGDVLFGQHAKVVCPHICDHCAAPYIWTFTADGSEVLYCTSEQPTETQLTEAQLDEGARVPGGTLGAYFSVSAALVLLLVPLLVLRRLGNLVRSRRRLAAWRRQRYAGRTYQSYAPA